MLYCKTNVSQGLILGETKNNMNGQTLNPHSHHNLSCGGSGGSGALLALGGSSLGVATDIGGSVCNPAAFNGVFGLKPTPERAYHTVTPPTPTPARTRTAPPSAFSPPRSRGWSWPCARPSLPSLGSGIPPSCPSPFRQHVVEECTRRADPGNSASPLKLGILWTDGIVRPHPPIYRGLKMVAEAVKQAGHKVVDWTPPAHSRAVAIHSSFLRADGFLDVQTQLDLTGEPLLQPKAALRPPSSLLEYQAATLESLAYEAKYSDYWNSTANEDG